MLRYGDLEGDFCADNFDLSLEFVGGVCSVPWVGPFWVVIVGTEDEGRVEVFWRVLRLEMEG